MTAAGIDSMVLKYMLVDVIVVTLEIQEEVVGITLAAQPVLEAITLRLLVDQDNISTSAVLESGLDQIDQSQESIQKEKLDGDSLDRVPLGVTGVQIVQLELTIGIIASEMLKLLHAHTLEMMLEVPGGLVISKEPITLD
jgi:hypothetical protein